LAECAGALRRAHGLTRAEADVALALADGQGLDAIAAQRSVAIATVRSQVQSVYAKMGVHRQAELAAAVRRLSGR
jgi:DNA-binding CsgD family transcriptional regulator